MSAYAIAVGRFYADLAERLAEEKVFVSVRGGSVRVSPHLYNTEEDVERLFSVLAKMLRRQA